MPRASSSSLTFICICKLGSRPYLSLSPSQSHPYSSAPPPSAQTGVFLLQRISLSSSLCASSPLLLLLVVVALSPLLLLLSRPIERRRDGGRALPPPSSLPSPSFLPSCCPSIQSLPALTSSASLPIAFRQIYTPPTKEGPKERASERRRHFAPLLTRQCTALYLPSLLLPTRVTYENEKLSIIHMFFFSACRMFSGA